MVIIIIPEAFISALLINDKHWIQCLVNTKVDNSHYHFIGEQGWLTMKIARITVF